MQASQESNSSHGLEAHIPRYLSCTPLVGDEETGALFLRLYQGFGFALIESGAKQVNAYRITGSAPFEQAGSIEFLQLISEPGFSIHFSLHASGDIDYLEEERKFYSKP